MQNRFFSQFPFQFPLLTFLSCLLRLSLENLLFSACFQFFKEQQDNLTKLSLIGVPTGIRTPVTAVKGRCPRPLDDGDIN